jgi:hypothetical protein
MRYLAVFIVICAAIVTIGGLIIISSAGVGRAGWSAQLRRGRGTNGRTGTPAFIDLNPPAGVGPRRNAMRFVKDGPLPGGRVTSTMSPTTATSTRFARLRPRLPRKT